MIQTTDYKTLSASDLIKILELQDQLLQTQGEKIEILQFQLANLNKVVFGKSSERFPRQIEYPGQAW